MATIFFQIIDHTVAEIDTLYIIIIIFYFIIIILK